MVIYEQLYEFERLLEAISNGFTIVEKPDTDTMLLTLNISQLRYIKDRYLNKGDMASTVEFLRKKSDDLRNIIQPAELLNATPIATGPYQGIGYTVPVTSTSQPYLFYLRSDSYLTRTISLPTSGYVWSPNIILDSMEDIDKILTNLYNKPILRQPVVFFQSDGITIITDSYTTINAVNGFSMTYVRQPKYLGISTAPGWNPSTQTETCELATHTHEEITRLAVDIYIKEYKFLLSSKSNAKQESVK